MDNRMVQWEYHGNTVVIPLVPEGLDDFQPWTDDQEALDEAWNMLTKLAADPYFAGPGQRNDDGVNLGISLFVLGCPDQFEWLHTVDECGLHLDDDDMKELYNKLVDVDGYLYPWSHNGNDARACLAMAIS